MRKLVLLGCAAALVATVAIAQTPPTPPSGPPGAPKADPGPPGTVKIEPGFSTKGEGATKVQVTPPIPVPPAGTKSDIPPPPPAAKAEGAPPPPPPGEGPRMDMSPRHGGMGYEDKFRPWHGKGKRSKAAHFRIDRPGNGIDIKCDEDEPMRACVDAAIVLIDKLNAQR